MSEQYIHVACRCFRDKRTSQSPVPPSSLRLDGFGNVVLAGGTNADDFPEDLFDWMSDHACPHHYMREIETIFHPYLEYPPARLRDDRELMRPGLVAELDSGGYPRLRRVLDAFPHAHGIVVRPDQARGVLDDLTRLASLRLPATTRVLIDENGRRLSLDPDGFDGGPDFMSVYGNPRIDSARTNLLEVGVAGEDVVIRSATSHEEVLRGRTIEQEVGSEEATVGYWILRRVAYRDVASGAVVHGYGLGVGPGSFMNLHEPHHVYSRSLRVAGTALAMSDTVYFPRPLKAALEACIKTANPVVTYYSGHSLGFEGAPESFTA